MSCEQAYKFRVAMTCNACLEAVKRSLNKSLGSRIISVEGDLNEQVLVFQPKGVKMCSRMLNLRIWKIQEEKKRDRLLSWIAN